MLKWSAFPLKHATGNTMSEFIAENRGADAITRPNWSAVFSVAFCVACLIIVEFLPVSLLTPMAQDLGISEGVAGQSVTVTAFVAMFASLFITQTIQATDRRYVVILFAVLLTLSCLLVSFANRWPIRQKKPGLFRWRLFSLLIPVARQSAVMRWIILV